MYSALAGACKYIIAIIGKRWENSNRQNPTTEREARKMFISRNRLRTLEERISDLETDLMFLSLRYQQLKQKTQNQQKRMKNHIKQKKHGADACPF